MERALAMKKYGVMKVVEKNIVKRAEQAARRKDYKEAFHLLLIADKAGNAEASYALGTWYLFGRFVEKDMKKAASYFSKASKKGYKEALFNLALCYEKGVGVEKDLTKSFSYYLNALAQGEQSAAFEVGRMLYYGLGVSKNRQLAEHFFKLSNIKIDNVLSSVKQLSVPPRKKALAEMI